MILVTGATGLVGSHLLYELCSNGANVRAMYRTKERIERVEQLFTFYQPEQAKDLLDKIEWVVGDVNDIESLVAAMKGCKQVYHAAALVSFNNRDFHRLMKINREGTTNIVNCALAEGIEKLAHLSSTAAIGNTSSAIITEESKWNMAGKNTAYSISKYGAEREIWRGIEEGLNAVIVNPSVILGPGNWNEGSLVIFRTVNKGLKFYTPGQNAFVDVRDVAKCLRLLMESPLQAQRYLCFSENVPFRVLTDEIATQLGKKKAKYATQPWMAGIAWRAARVLSLFTGKRPTLTRESVRSAFSRKHYSNEKIKTELNYEFIPVKDAIDNAIKGRIF